MRKRHLVIVGFLFISFFYSCKKDSTSLTKHIITYKITSSNYKLLSNISYTDTLGVQSTASAVDSTSGWSKTISESYTGFTVVLEVTGQNSATSTLNYTLEILVDGTSKAIQQNSTPPFNSFNTQISAIIQ